MEGTLTSGKIFASGSATITGIDSNERGYLTVRNLNFKPSIIITTVDLGSDYQYYECGTYRSEFNSNNSVLSTIYPSNYTALNKNITIYNDGFRMYVANYYNTDLRVVNWIAFE